MYPKHFFEQFWESEQRNELFVCMPFHSSLNYRFNQVIKVAAKKAGFDNAIRVDEDTSGNVIITKILDGIANSKMVLVDLSDDPSCKERHVNGNVLYEAGIVHAIREPDALIIVRDQGPEGVDFDIRGFTINTPPNNVIEEKWLIELLKNSLENYQWFIGKRIKSTAELIDDISLLLMAKYGGDKNTSTHFNSANMDAKYKISIMRLLELGILRFQTARNNNPLEHAYHWTDFGYEVMKYLHIERQNPGIRLS